MRFYFVSFIFLLIYLQAKLFFCAGYSQMPLISLPSSEGGRRGGAGDGPGHTVFRIIHPPEEAEEEVQSNITTRAA
jgi:hypothetical protein